MLILCLSQTVKHTDTTPPSMARHTCQPLPYCSWYSSDRARGTRCQYSGKSRCCSTRARHTPSCLCKGSQLGSQCDRGRNGGSKPRAQSTHCRTRPCRRHWYRRRSSLCAVYHTRPCMPAPRHPTRLRTFPGRSVARDNSRSSSRGMFDNRRSRDMFGSNQWRLDCPLRNILPRCLLRDILRRSCQPCRCNPESILCCTLCPRRSHTVDRTGRNHMDSPMNTCRDMGTDRNKWCGRDCSFVDTFAGLDCLNIRWGNLETRLGTHFRRLLHRSTHYNW